MRSEARSPADAQAMGAGIVSAARLLPTTRCGGSTARLGSGRRGVEASSAGSVPASLRREGFTFPPEAVPIVREAVSMFREAPLTVREGFPAGREVPSSAGEGVSSVGEPLSIAREAFSLANEALSTASEAASLASEDPSFVGKPLSNDDLCKIGSF